MKPVPRLNAEQASRYWSRVTKTGTCWLWSGSCTRGGYGTFRYASSRLPGSQLRCNRVAWTIAHGDIPEGLFVLHKCDNPPCVNPDHLFLGTLKDNTRDMWAKGRQGPFGLRELLQRKREQTHCLRGHLYTPDNTIRLKNGTRRCRQCSREDKFNRYWRDGKQRVRARYLPLKGVS